MKDRSVVKGKHKASYVCGFSQSSLAPRTSAVRLIDFFLLLYSIFAFWETVGTSTRRRYGLNQNSLSAFSSTSRPFSLPEAVHRSRASVAASSSRNHRRAETAPRSMNCSRVTSRHSTFLYMRTQNGRLITRTSIRPCGSRSRMGLMFSTSRLVCAGSRVQKNSDEKTISG